MKAEQKRVEVRRQRTTSTSIPAFSPCSHRQARNAVWEHVRSCEAPTERRRPERKTQRLDSIVKRARAQYVSVGLEALGRVSTRLDILMDKYRAGHGSTDVFAKRYRTTERRTEGSFHETEPKKRSILPDTTKDKRQLAVLPISLKASALISRSRCWIPNAVIIPARSKHSSISSPRRRRP